MQPMHSYIQRQASKLFPKNAFIFASRAAKRGGGGGGGKRGSLPRAPIVRGTTNVLQGAHKFLIYMPQVLKRL